MKMPPIHVLLIEDDDRDFERLRALFREFPAEAYHLDRVATYDDALHAFEHCSHDLYLVDHRPGGRTGLEVLAEAQRRHCAAPLILLTPQGDHDLDLRAREAGAADSLPKEGLDPVRLEKSMRYALESARQRIAESQHFLRSVLDALPDRIVVFDEHGTIVAANEAWRRFIEANGFATDAYAVGNDYFQACRSPRAGCPLEASVAAAIRDVAAGRRSGFDALYECALPATTRWFELHASPFEWRGARRVVLAHDDVTPRVASESALRRGSERLRESAKIAARLNAAQDVVSVLNILTQGAASIVGAHQCVANHRTGRDWSNSVNVVSLSEKYAAWHDYAAEIDGSGIYAVVCKSGRPLRLTQDELERHPAWRNFGDQADRHPPLRGWLAAPLVGRDGRNLGIVQLSDRFEGDFTAEDETVLVQLAQMASVALENALLYRDLREADRRKDQFLATLAHELRNPLSPLTAAAQLMALDPGNAAQVTELTGMMSRQLDQLRRLIDDLLDVSRISSGKLMLRREPVLLREAIAAAVDVSRPLFDAVGHRLTVVAETRPMVVFGDKVRLAQVVGNLLINSAKYTQPGGRIALETRIEAGHAVVSVSDDGIGIEADMLQRIFGLFTQIDSSNTRAQGGLGIGLTLAKTLVEMHGGTIQAVSPGPGRGSTFIVRLPLADPALAQPSPREPEPDIALPARRVLVVDDNESAAYLLSRLLEKLHQRVKVAHCVADAVRALEEFEPDVLISDIAMPGESGYDLATKVRNRASERRPFLVALTGYGQESDRLQALESGFDFHLTKPIGLAALKELLGGLAERGRTP